MTGRVFNAEFAWLMSADQAAAAGTILASIAAARYGTLGLVAGVANGGPEPAAAIARSLHAPLAIIRARHNATSAIRVQATGQVHVESPELRPGVVHGTVLVVDDIFGTGATLDAVISALAALAAPETRLHTATLCRNAGTERRPDLTVWDDLQEWVVFPWEAPPPPGTPLRPLPAPRKVGAA